MSRISIDVTPQQHRRLKALAALQGKSIKGFVLASTIGARSEDSALMELEALLDRRFQEARTTEPNTSTVGDVFQQARTRVSPVSDA